MNADYFLASIAFGLLFSAMRPYWDAEAGPTGFSWVDDLLGYTAIALLYIALALAILGFFL